LAVPEEEDAERFRLHPAPFVGAWQTWQALTPGGPERVPASWREVSLVAEGASTVRVRIAPAAADAWSLKASMYGDADMHRDVPTLVDHWRAGRLDLETLVTQRIRFEELK
jgi:hypothetical protein